MSNLKSILFTESKASQNRIWQFKIHCNFSPSTSNKVYVMSDIKDVIYTKNGYFAKNGRLRGSTDNINLHLEEDGAVNSYKKSLFYTN